MAISYALTLTGSLGGVVNIFVETERKMVALERVNDYIENTKTEPSETTENAILPFAWPSQGVVSFSNVYLKYRFEILIFLFLSFHFISVLRMYITVLKKKNLHLMVFIIFSYIHVTNLIRIEIHIM